MSNITVTILEDGRCDDYGIPLVTGNSYSIDYDKAKSLVQAGFASVADPAVFDDDNSPGSGGFVRYTRFSGFKRLLLASLAANSTASRSNGLVTVTATSHGVTTGATYQGFRFFYPGSAALTAGWYDSIVTIPDANTITFSAPGADFGSQSVNGAAIYTTETTAWTGVLPGNTLITGSEMVHRVFKAATNSANQHTVKMKIGSVGNIIHVSLPTGSTPNSWSEGALFVPEPNKVAMVSGSMASGNSAFTYASLDLTVDQPLSLTVQLAAASEFLAVLASSFTIHR